MVKTASSSCRRHAAALVALIALYGEVSGQSLLTEWPGSAPGDQIGNLVAAIGDTDSDGYPDVAACNIFTALTPKVLRVISGRTGATRFEVGTQSSFHSVRSMGLMDADGIPDLVAGEAYRNDHARNSVGAATLLSGKDGSVIRQWFGPESYSQFGWTVANAGDADGDGRSDLLVGAFAEDAPGLDSGAAYLYSGSSGVLLRRMKGSAAWLYFGFAVAGGSDVDGDSVPDCIVGQQNANAQDDWRGAAFVYSGASGALLYYYAGTHDYDLLGHGVELLDDLDGDGCSEFAVAASGEKVGALVETGVVRIHSGANGAVLRSLPGVMPGERFGRVIDTAPDLDGDGVREFMVGGAGGRIVLYSGRTGVVLRQWVGVFGSEGRTCILGDLDQDGLTEIANGEVWSDSGGDSSGRIGIYQIPGFTLYVDRTDLKPGETLNVMVGDGLPGAQLMIEASVPLGFLDPVTGRKTFDANRMFIGSATVPPPPGRRLHDQQVTLRAWTRRNGLGKVYSNEVRLFIDWP